MKNYIVSALSFIVGGVLGYFTAQSLLKNKYETIAQQEIDSVKRVFKEQQDKKQKKKASDLASGKPPISDYVKQLKDLGYSKEAEVPKEEDKPVIIAPEDFGTEPGYDSETLTYYANEVVTDERGDILEDDELEEYLGTDWKSHFGEYEDDSIHVRNPRLKMEYEVLKDLSDYTV